MKLKLLLIALCSFATLNSIFSCSCSTIHFCEFVNSQESFLAFRGIIIKHSEFEPFPNGFGGQAIYVKIIKKYKDNIGVGDTIKLYGSYDGATCTENLIQRPIGSTMICAFGEGNHNGGISNPDSLAENYWEWFPNSCFFPNLSLEDETVKGVINSQVRKYPLNLFEENLSNCNFTYDEIIDYDCTDQKMKVYPNPSIDGTVFIKSNYFSNSISNIEIYHIDGSPINSYQSFERINIDKIQVKGFRYGVNILKIEAANKTCFKYIISNETK